MDGKELRGTRDALGFADSRGGDFIVARDRLVMQLLGRGEDADIVFICAPQGFGKTALLLCCATAVRSDPEYGVAVLIGAGSLSPDELVERVERCAGELSPAAHPYILIDDLPVVKTSQFAMLADCLRALRSEGYSIIATCTPDNRPFVNAVGDSHKIGAQALRVQPREYSRWAKAFSISNALDVYELTQGIPALVAALRSVSAGDGGTVHLDGQIEEVYRAALRTVSHGKGALSRLLMLFVLLESGSFNDFERCGIRVRSELVAELIREYPIFSIDVDGRTFACLGKGRKVLDRLRASIAHDNPELLKKAVRIKMRSREVDYAIKLMRSWMPRKEALEIVSQFPAAFALAGHAQSVRALLAHVEAPSCGQVDIGLVLALYLASLTAGEYRTARSAAQELCRRAREVEQDVSPEDWGCALAVRSVWATCRGIDLPTLSDGYLKGCDSERSRALALHARLYAELIATSGEAELAGEPEPEGSVGSYGGQLDIPRLLLRLDGMLSSSLHEGVLDVADDDAELSGLAKRLTDLRLVPLAARVRMVAAVRRLLAGLPLVDERALGDAGTVAVREADLSTQLFCLVAEGWQALSLGQVVNAQFRAQQVLKLVEPEQPFLCLWAQLLEKTAQLLNSSRVAIREEAETFDLACKVEGVVDAWMVALHLSAARFDSDLSVWFSLHKELLLRDELRPVIRLAIVLLGERADSVRRLIPHELRCEYMLGGETLRREKPLLEVMGSGVSELGQVNINLFGGFQVDRNGHLLTEALWHRKKVGILAARLVLSLGAFVERDVIVREMWPDSEFPRARQNLYTATSTLKAAFHQDGDGPQYLLTQGDGIALNGEFVSSDTLRFDMLAREILLKRIGASSRTIMEACLKLEEIYTGPLFVPGSGDTSFFMRMRHMYESKYIDCLVRGIDAAMEDEDTSTASWLSDAALKQAPTREDVLRRVMRVYGACGRRREVADLYGAHLYYLKNELCCEPEAETVRVYEEVVDVPGRRACLA